MDLIYDGLEDLQSLINYSKMDKQKDILTNANLVDNLTEDLNIDEAMMKAEKKLVHKFDLRLMPLFTLMYFFSSLDRSNIGNAKVAGMNTDLGITSAQYSTAVSVLYATYIPVMIPGVWLMRKFEKPRYYLALMMTCWSLVTIFTVFINNYASLLAVRLLIGFFEGSFFSCMAVITTDYYFPQELGRRFAYLFASSSLSSAFGGLVATGITKIHTGPLAAWRYLYLIEGLLSMAAMLWLFFGLPDDPSQLLKTEEEGAVFESRTARRALYSPEEHFKSAEIKAAYKDWKTWFSVIIQFTQDICLYGFSTFLPSILQSGLGFNSLASQYLTIPVYLFAGFIFLAAAELSDRYKKRGPMIIFLNIFGIIGYILLLSVNSSAVKYFACYLICFSLYTGTGINEAWITSNTAPALKRSTALATNQALGNVAGIISPQVYRDAPKYMLGHAFTLGCLVVSSLTCAICSWYLHRKNRRNIVLREEPEKQTRSRTIGDDSPDFTFII